MNKKQVITIIIFLIIIVILVFSFTVANNDDKTNNGDDNDQNFVDSDKDGVSDDKDDFPDDPAASQDTDKDGYPDSWNSGKEKKDSTKNLTLDSFPDDPSAHLDSDDDGYPNSWNKDKSRDDSTSIPPLEIDEFPDDPNAHKDTDKDGYADYYDKNDYVNLSLTLEIQKFKLINKVDFLPWGQIYFVIDIGGEKKEFKNYGFGWWAWLKIDKLVNLKFEYDIPDDTEEDFTTISISMYDFDLFIDDYQLDIGKESDEKSIKIRFDNIKNTVDFDGIINGNEASLWLDINYPKEGDDEERFYEKTYTWKYQGEKYALDQQIPESTYNEYLSYEINRMPTFNNAKHFVTSNEPVVEDISDKLEKISNEKSFNSYEEANFILKFVQKNVEYASDNDTKNQIEYWKFPVETLVEQTGDCEDTSILYASILDDLGYDTVLLYYKWEENGKKLGHLSVGVNLQGDYGEYILEDEKKYYYCETTNDISNVGEIPDDPPNIKDGPAYIIHI